MRIDVKPGVNCLDKSEGKNGLSESKQLPLSWLFTSVEHLDQRVWTPCQRPLLPLSVGVLSSFS